MQWDTAAALAPLGEKAEEFKDLEALVKDVVGQAEQGDTILVMSNGGFGGVHKKLLDGLKSKFGANLMRPTLICAVLVAPELCEAQASQRSA